MEENGKPQEESKASPVVKASLTDAEVLEQDTTAETAGDTRKRTFASHDLGFNYKLLNLIVNIKDISKVILK